MNWKAFNLGLGLCALATVAGYLALQRGPARPSRPVTVAPEKLGVAKDSELPVLVDFYADWCGPCRAEKPIVERASQEWAGRVKFVKLNIDEDKGRLAASLGINAIPSMVLMNPRTKSGFLHTGFLGDDQLREFIKQGLQTVSR